ncbi:U11/U12 small nuclear ribonucleoprotein 65 kDa protein [Bienertia sinuspersici]
MIFYPNYTAGNPASVLYIKNLAKDVVPDDFYFIFGSFFGSVEAAKSSLSVKLMQEGRMRGQAFVTFPSVELAHRALVSLWAYLILYVMFVHISESMTAKQYAYLSSLGELNNLPVTASVVTGQWSKRQRLGGTIGIIEHEYTTKHCATSERNLVNGYSFKGKPMIIQFGRNPAATKTS